MTEPPSVWEIDGNEVGTSVNLSLFFGIIFHKTKNTTLHGTTKTHS